MSILKNENLIKASSGLPDDYIENFRMRLRITKGCKYAASKRLLRHSELSKTTLGFLSAYLVIVNIWFAFSKTNKFDYEDFSLISVSLSIVILIYGQIVASKDFKHRAQKFKQKASEIDRILDKLLFTTKSLYKDSEKLLVEVNELSKKYSMCIKDDQIHSLIDYKKFLMSEGLEPFKLEAKSYSRIESFGINFEYNHLGFVQYYALTWITPLIVILWYYFI